MISARVHNRVHNRVSQFQQLFFCLYNFFKYFFFVFGFLICSFCFFISKSPHSYKIALKGISRVGLEMRDVLLCAMQSSSWDRRLGRSFIVPSVVRRQKPSGNQQSIHGSPTNQDVSFYFDFNGFMPG